MELSAALAQLGLDPQLGFWHAPRHRRPSLALDLLEEFQPALGEETVLAAFQQGQLTDAAFTAGETGITLTKAGCRVLSSHLYNRLRQPAPSNNGGSQRQYKQLLHRQAEVLASHLLEDSTPYQCHEDK
jgi:CRISPR-associated endonuclease Cas1